MMRAGNIKSLILIPCFLLLIHELRSQIPESEADAFNYHFAEKGTFSFSPHASTFFHNNEFFDTFIEGYTLTGAWLQPKIHFSLNERLTTGAGIHLMKYNGKDKFDQIRPWFNLQYKFSDAFALTMGSFNGGESLYLPEPLYDTENNYTGILNNGIRLDYVKSFMRTVTWLDWETFIEPADTFREEFTVGNSSVFQIAGNENYQLNLPFHILFHHKGGQINQSDEPTVTFTELASGINMNAFTGNPVVSSVSFSLMSFYNQRADEEKNGFAIYPRFFLQNKFFELSSGYYYGKRFRTEKGEPLFFHHTNLQNGNFDNRKLFTFKTGFKKQLAGNSFLSLSFDGWYDLQIQKLQYSYGLYIVVNEWYSLGQ